VRNNVLLTLQTDKALPEMLPGQFVEVRADGGDTFLRRPISIHQALPDEGLIRLLVAVVGKGTRRLAALRPGDSLNCVLPLGNSFTLPESVSERPLLVGGGVGVAPLLFLGTCLKQRGITPVYLFGRPAPRPTFSGSTLSVPRATSLSRPKTAVRVRKATSPSTVCCAIPPFRASIPAVPCP